MNRNVIGARAVRDRVEFGALLVSLGWHWWSIVDLNGWSVFVWTLDVHLVRRQDRFRGLDDRKPPYVEIAPAADHSLVRGLRPCSVNGRPSAVMTLPVTALSSAVGINVIINERTLWLPLIMLLAIMLSLSLILLRWFKATGIVVSWPGTTTENDRRTRS